MDIIAHWNNYYDQNKDFGLIDASTIDKIISKNDDGKMQKRLLDLGCGTGQLTREFNHRGYECIGIDSSESAVEKAKRYTVKNDELQYFVKDIEQCNFRELSAFKFNIITCKLVYAFIEDKYSFLSKINDILNETGVFVLITPLKSDVPETPKIAVDYNQTVGEISDVFSRFDEFKVNRTTYFLCYRQ